MTDKKIPVIFILGSGHCGSTLLDLLLDSHPDIFGAGELQRIAIEEGDEFWDKIKAKAGILDMRIHQEKRSALLGKKEYYFVGSGRKVNKSSYITYHEKLFSFIKKATGAKLIVDSSKNPDRVELLAESDQIKPFILHLVRDGRGVTWSYIKKYPRAPVTYFFKWFFTNMKIEIIRLRTGLPYIFVHYKYLTRDPKNVLTYILSFFAQSFVDEQLTFRQHKHHQLGGNRMKRNNTQEIHRDISWKRKMPFLSQLLFVVLFGWLNAYYYLRNDKS